MKVLKNGSGFLGVTHLHNRLVHSRPLRKPSNIPGSCLRTSADWMNSSPLKKMGCQSKMLQCLPNDLERPSR